MLSKEQIQKNNIKKVIKTLHNNKKATVIAIGNQKGGVGKTTNTCLIAYRLAKRGVKTLVIDTDPQSNATKMLSQTRDKIKPDVTVLEKTLFAGIRDGSLEDLPINIMDNLDLIPSNIDMKFISKYIYMTYDNDYDYDHYLEPLVRPLKDKYDIILFDTPPFVPEINDNVITSCDYVLISLQTQQDSLDGASDFIKYTLQPKADLYNLNIEVIGILPILFDDRSSVDFSILDRTKKEFGEQNVFKTIVKNRARIKHFPKFGITDNNMYEHRVMQMFEDVTDELLLRLGLFMGVIDDE